MMTRIKRRKMFLEKSFLKNVRKRRKRDYIMVVPCLPMELSQAAMEPQDLQEYLLEDKVT